VRLWKDLVDASGMRDFHIDEYIYIRVEPEEAHRRIIHRARVRTAERAVSLEYIASIHNLYESYFSRMQQQHPSVTLVDNSPSSPNAAEAIMTHCNY